MNFLFLKLSKYVLGQYVSKSFPKWWARWINIHKNTHSHGQSWVCVAFLIHQLQAHSFPSLKNEYSHERESHTKALNLLTFKYEKQVLEKSCNYCWYQTTKNTTDDSIAQLPLCVTGGDNDWPQSLPLWVTGFSSFKLLNLETLILCYDQISQGKFSF